MTIDPDVSAALTAMPLTRLAHFTPAKNLPPILAAGCLRSVTDMSADVRAYYTPTDLQRLDGYPDRICTSFEYPNGFYFARAAVRPEAINYSDWVCLLLDKQTAAATDTLFCPRNAASNAACIPGVAGLHACYASAVTGSGGHVFTRTARHNPACATDVQAEILIPSPIPLSAVRGFVVPTEQAAAQEHGRLTQLGSALPAHIPWVVSPDMFSKNAITTAVRSRSPLTETVWSTAAAAARRP